MGEQPIAFSSYMSCQNQENIEYPNKNTTRTYITFLRRLADRQGWKLAWLWLALVSSVFAYASMARWWTDTSMPRLQEAEAALLEKYAQVHICYPVGSRGPHSCC